MGKKLTTTAQPMIGAESLQILANIAHDLAPQVRASSGLATALRSIYTAKLEEAESQTDRLGKQPSDDGVAYARQCYLTQELRGLVAILGTLDNTLEKAARRSGRMEELTRRCKGGAR